MQTRILAALVGVLLATGAWAQCVKNPSCTLASPPATQTIDAGGTIAADACGTVKRISSAGSVTTSTANTFSAPSGGGDGCWMAVCNVGSNNIVLDNNANFKSAAGGDVTLTADDCVSVVQAGNVWYQVSALLAN